MKLLRKFLHPRRDPVPPRDTDRDWQAIGASQPFYGVLTDQRFRTENLDEQAIAEFYDYGRGDIASAWDRMQQWGPFVPRSALDFGCGVGRLSIPLFERTGRVVGVDVSPGMLAQARRHAPAGVEFSQVIPDEPFDWVVSLIVFQHIPPARGMALLRRLLACVAPGGGATIQLMFARTELHRKSPGARIVLGPDGAEAVPAADHRRLPEGTMLMHDYDMSAVLAEFHAAGMTALALEFCDHGGHIGAILYGRKPG